MGCVQVSMMERDVYLGRILTGHIASGVVQVGDRVHGLRCTEGNSTPFDECKVNTIMASFLLKCVNWYHSLYDLSQG